MRQKKLVIFDWDGTIVDSLSVWANAYNTLSREFGFRRFTPGSFGDWLSLDWNRNFRRLNIPRREWKKSLQRLRDYYNRADTKIIPGMREVIKRISDEYDVAVVTNTHDFLVLRKIRKLNLPIKKVFGPVEGKHKPDPAQLLGVLKKLKLNPNDVVYVGDMSFDVIAAHRAKIKAIGLATKYSFHRREKIIKSAPEYLATSPRQIIRFVKKILI